MARSRQIVEKKKENVDVRSKRTPESCTPWSRSLIDFEIFMISQAFLPGYYFDKIFLSNFLSKPEFGVFANTLINHSILPLGPKKNHS